MRLLLVLPAVLAIGAFTACGDTGEGGSVDITLRDDQTPWSIETDVDSLPKGPIEFTVENTGSIEHEVLIIETDIAPDKLPTKDDGSIDEDAPDVDVKYKIEKIGDGEKTGRTYELDAGSWVFACNIVKDGKAHYQQGMRTSFTIEDK